MLGQVTPGCTGLGDPEDGIDEEAIVLGGDTGLTHLAGEEILDTISMLIRDLMATHASTLRWKTDELACLSYPNPLQSVHTA